MGSAEVAHQDRPSKFSSSFKQSGVWIFVSLVPILFLARLFVLTLYSSPESDDFCLSELYAAKGFAETIWIWYHSVVGRVVPLILIQIPAVVNRATGIDYFLSYGATLAGFDICFAAAFVFFASRLWPRANLPMNIFVGTALAAMTLSGVPSLREMLYWLPGVTCYTFPGVIFMLVLVEFARAAETGARIRPVVAGMLATGCFVASLCNEFTPVWLVGLVVCSVIIRMIFMRDNLQIREHCIVGATTLAAFAILLVAPGNTVRIGMFPMAGDVGHSVVAAYGTLVSDFNDFMFAPQTLIWLLVTVMFTLMLPQAIKVDAWKRLLLAALLLIFCFACSYIASFAARYATGYDLPTRAQNEKLMLLYFGTTISATILTRACWDLVPRSFAAIPGRSNASLTSVLAVVLGMIIISPIYKGDTMNLLRSEQDSFRIFWLESMQRHARLTLSTEQDLVVANRSVFPSVLMAEEMTENPALLPNDCIARYYGKRTVVIKPEVQTATTSQIVAVLSNLIASIRASKAPIGEGLVVPPMLSSSNIQVPALLARGQVFSSQWGRVVMTRSQMTSVLDFYSVPRDVCRELLLGASRIDGVERVAGTGAANDEMQAPIDAEESRKSCPADKNIVRIIFSNFVNAARLH
jgi:hypothetical protein